MAKDLKRRIVAEFSAQNKAKGIMSGFRRDMDTTGRAMRRMAAGALAVAGIGGFGYMLKKTMESIDQIAKMSDELQISTEALTGLEHAAKISGTSIESLHKAIGIFVRRMGEAKYGVGEGVRGLKMLNLTAEEIISMGTEKAFMKIAESISQAGTAAEQAGIAYNFFGRQGTQLLNMFQLGREGIEAMREEAERLGLTLSRWDAAQVEAANDALTRARALFTGLFRQVTVELSPYIKALADRFVEFATSGEGVGANVVNAFEAVSLSIVRTAEEVERLINKLAALTSPVDHMRKLTEATEEAWRRYREETGETQAGKYTLGPLYAPIQPKDRELFDRILAEERAGVGVEVLNQESRVRALFDKIRSEGAARREQLEEKAKQRAAAGVGVVPEVEEAKVVISAERRKMLALEKAVDVEIELLGRLNEPRQHARQLIQYEAAAMEMFAGNAQAAAAATEDFRDKLEELEEAQKWAEWAKTMEQSFAGALERLSQDWRNYGDVAKGVLREILMEMMRIMVWRPVAQAGADLIQIGLGAVGNLFSGGGGGNLPALSTPGGRTGMGYQHGGIATHPHLAMVGEVPEAFVPLSGGRSIPVEMRGGTGPPSFTFVMENQTGTPLKIEEQRQGTNPREFILTVVADDAIHGGMLADIFQTRQG